MCPRWRLWARRIGARRRRRRKALLFEGWFGVQGWGCFDDDDEGPLFGEGPVDPKLFCP